MGEVVRMVDSREGEQTQRFRWGECFNGYTVQDTETGATRGMGDGVDMFCNEDGEECLMPGTQRFYDALNGYFENEQSEIAKGLLRHQSRERGEANIMSTDYDAGLVVGFASRCRSSRTWRTGSTLRRASRRDARRWWTWRAEWDCSC
jgi:hypothetical protein